MTTADDQDLSAEALKRARVDSHVAFGRTFLQRGDYVSALSSFERALDLDRVELRAMMGKSLALTRLGRYEEALVAADEICGREPHHAGAYSAKGVCLHAMGRDADAESAFRRSIACGPSDPAVHYNFACFWAAKGSQRLCREYLSRAIELNPQLNVVAATDIDLKLYRDETWFQDLVAFKKT